MLLCQQFSHFIILSSIPLYKKKATLVLSIYVLMDILFIFSILYYWQYSVFCNTDSIQLSWLSIMNIDI